MKYSIFRTTSFKKGFKELNAKEQDAVLSIVARLAEEILELALIETGSRAELFG